MLRALPHHDETPVGIHRHCRIEALNLIRFNAGEDGKATIKVKGTGDFLNVDWEGSGIYGFRLPVTAQLSASNGECWKAVFPTAHRNFLFRFQAKDGSPGGAFVDPAPAAVVD